MSVCTPQTAYQPRGGSEIISEGKCATEEQNAPEAAYKPHRHITQCDWIIEHMQLHGSITTMQAYEMYGITRLASRIYDLRRFGYKILGFTETGTNRFGQKTTYTKYLLDMREE